MARRHGHNQSMNICRQTCCVSPPHTPPHPRRTLPRPPSCTLPPEAWPSLPAVALADAHDVSRQVAHARQVVLSQLLQAHNTPCMSGRAARLLAGGVHEHRCWLLAGQQQVYQCHSMQLYISATRGRRHPVRTCHSLHSSIAAQRSLVRSMPPVTTNHRHTAPAASSPAAWSYGHMQSS
jgi:hypothetical protein